QSIWGEDSPFEGGNAGIRQQRMAARGMSFPTRAAQSLARARGPCPSKCISSNGEMYAVKADEESVAFPKRAAPPIQAQPRRSFKQTTPTHPHTHPSGTSRSRL